ncbi:MAG: hypothetical protein ACRDZO_20435 [Egibacteraceae bacterium]
MRVMVLAATSLLSLTGPAWAQEPPSPDRCFDLGGLPAPSEISSVQVCAFPQPDDDPACANVNGILAVDGNFGPCERVIAED